MIGLEKRLEIGGAALPLAGQAIAPDLLPDETILELSAVGRGIYHVLSEARPEGKARFFLGYRGGELAPVLSGYVSDARVARPLVEPGDTGSARALWRVVVREPAGLLDTRADFHLRHVTAREVLAEIERITGLVFLTPAAGEYLERDTPHFAAEGTCRAALAALGRAFAAPRCVWATLPDGRIFWGDWAAGPFPGVADDAVAIDPALVIERDPEARRVCLTPMPLLRPGAVVTVDGESFMAARVAFRQSKMDVSWREVSE